MPIAYSGMMHDMTPLHADPDRHMPQAQCADDARMPIGRREKEQKAATARAAELAAPCAGLHCIGVPSIDLRRADMALLDHPCAMHRTATPEQIPPREIVGENRRKVRKLPHIVAVVLLR